MYISYFYNIQESRRLCSVFKHRKIKTNFKECKWIKVDHWHIKVQKYFLNSQKKIYIIYNKYEIST